jgi:hypothetical protein
VETETYRNGIRTGDLGIVNDKTRYGLEKLSEALYVSAYACVERHGGLAVISKQEGE